MVSENKVDYANKLILAPMVRVCTLPMRLLALRYGADLVYCEEIIDFKILSTKRVENDILGTVDYVLSDGTVVFRTCPRLERGKLIFQMGTCDAKRALMAAKKVEKDVDGIDINMGCPKEFSVKGGMGAALLTNPDKIKDILTTLVNGLSIPVTCKVRVLPDINDMMSLVKLIESTGVSALAVHGRTKEERPRHPNKNNIIKQIAQTLKIPVIANGGSKEIKCYKDIDVFRQQCGASSVMLARAAEWNPSIFRPQGVLPLFDVVREYVKLCLEFDSNYTNVKYCVLQMMHEDMDQQEGLDTQSSISLEQISDIWGLRDMHDKIVGEHNKRHKEHERLSGMLDIVVSEDDGVLTIRLPVQFLKRNYLTALSPKQMLYEWTKKVKTVGKPTFTTTERKEDRCYKCVLEVKGVKFTTPYWEKSKQLAEQGAAICASVVIGFQDGRQSECDEYDVVCERWKQFVKDYKEVDIESVLKSKYFGDYQNDEIDLGQDEENLSINLKRKFSNSCDDNSVESTKRRLSDIDIDGHDVKELSNDNCLSSNSSNTMDNNDGSVFTNCDGNS